MRNCTFSELSQKQVINLCDCKQLGFIDDIYFELETGRITSVKVCDQSQFLCFGKQNNKCICIPWECIKKIGDDIILTDIVCPAPPCQKPKKLFRSE